jgi:hypothetical protein
MTESDYIKNLSASRENIRLELASIDDLNAQWDWLIEHLQVYLGRLQSLCIQLERAPREFMRTSVYCNLIVATEFAEEILVVSSIMPPEWIRFRASLNDLSCAASVSHCLLCWNSLSELKF